MTEHRHLPPRAWHEALGAAREACARLWAEGRSPADALRAHGLEAPDPDAATWSSAASAIAELLAAPRLVGSRAA